MLVYYTFIIIIFIIYLIPAWFSVVLVYGNDNTILVKHISPTPSNFKIAGIEVGALLQIYPDKLSVRRDDMRIMLRNVRAKKLILLPG